MNTIITDTNKIILNGTEIPSSGCGMEMITNLYKSLGVAYPKYYKMDPLCRVGFMTTEVLLGNRQGDINPNHHAIVMIGRAGSMANDRKYQETIGEEAESYFPSPAVFVYTLANIVTGEIAIRHKLYGETASYLIDNYNPQLISSLLLSTFNDPEISTLTGGWIDCEDSDHFSARLVTIDREDIETEIINFFCK